MHLLWFCATASFLCLLSWVHSTPLKSHHHNGNCPGPPSALTRPMPERRSVEDIQFGNQQNLPISSEEKLLEKDRNMSKEPERANYPKDKSYGLGNPDEYDAVEEPVALPYLEEPQVYEPIVSKRRLSYVNPYAYYDKGSFDDSEPEPTYYGRSRRTSFQSRSKRFAKNPKVLSEEEINGLVSLLNLKQDAHGPYQARERNHFRWPSEEEQLDPRLYLRQAERARGSEYGVEQIDDDEQPLPWYRDYKSSYYSSPYSASYDYHSYPNQKKSAAAYGRLPSQKLTEDERIKYLAYLLNPNRDEE